MTMFVDKKDKRHGDDVDGRGRGATVRRKEDLYAVLIAYESSDQNPFEPGTRRYRMFERYLQNGTDSDGKPEQVYRYRKPLK